MTEYRFWLPGEPVAQARARTGKGFAFYPAKSAGYRKWAVLQLRNQLAGRPPLAGALKLTVTFHRTRPKSNRSTLPTVRPDLDNYVKMTCDALMDAGAIVDDGAMCVLHAEKLWTVDRPGVEVVVESLP
jgi:Holliday junction resolvase RusA-like endonuclease